jgi:hypothetical protein
MLTSTVSEIAINYTTAKHAINFDITFGEGKEDADGISEKERKNFTNNYDIEVFESGEGDDYAKGYRVITNEGPLVIKLGNISIQNENSKYDYAIGFALDNEAPEYYLNYSTIPINIKRDGTMWTIPANNSLGYNFDQNPNAKYQWLAKKALDEGYKRTEEELKLGMEETSQNTGLIYLTFMVFSKLKQEPVTRGTTRCGGGTRCGDGTRGGDGTRSSSAARFGYGNEASSASVKSEFEYATGTEKYVLPIRLRISDESAICNINCSRHLEGANLNALRRQTMTVPF